MSRMLIAAVGWAIIMTLACGGDDDEEPVPTPDEPAATGEVTGLNVVGQGEVFIEPESFTVHLVVDARALEPATALVSANDSMMLVEAALSEAGVDAEAVRSESIGLLPEYDYNQVVPPIIGHLASNSIQVEAADEAEVARIVDAASQAAPGLVRVNYISFEMDGNEELLGQARRDAIDDARAKAEALAMEMGVELGDPLTIIQSTTGEPAPVFFGTGAPFYGYGYEYGFQPLELYVTVEVVYAIE